MGVNQSRLDNTLTPLVGSMLCGLSLLIQNRHRRGEMALYVMPRALFSATGRLLRFLKKRSWWDAFGAKWTKDLVFATFVMVVIHALYKDKNLVRPSVCGLMSWILRDELNENKVIKEHSEEEEEETLEINIKKSASD